MTVSFPSVSGLMGASGLVMLGCGYGAVWAIDAIRRSYLEKSRPGATFKDRPVERVGVIAQVRNVNLVVAMGMALGWRTIPLTVALSCFVVGFKVGEYVWKRQFRVDVKTSITGNPTHLGHVDMLALAMKRLEEEGYWVNQVQVELSDEGYVKDKVHWSNVSIQKHRDEAKSSADKVDMFKVLIPKETRMKFAKAAVRQAKAAGIFPEGVKVNIHFWGEGNLPDGRKIFEVCGNDFANEEPSKAGAAGSMKHVVIVTRNRELPRVVFECHNQSFCRLIVDNRHSTNTYSSSRIQNGDYELLPLSIRKEFEELHKAVQT